VCVCERECVFVCVCVAYVYTTIYVRTVSACLSYEYKIRCLLLN